MSWRDVISFAVGAAATVTAPVLRLAPRLLTASDPPTRVDAIIALGGDVGGQRVVRAVELWKQGYAPVVVMSGGQMYPGTTWAALMAKHAVVLGVPQDKILIQDRSWTTMDDAKCTAQLLNERGSKRAIITTSSWHSARALADFKKAEPGIAWTSCPLAQEWTGDWWRDPGVARSIISEFLKFVWPDR